MVLSSNHHFFFRVFFDIEVDDGLRRENYGRIKIELFDEVVPCTARNFYAIASGQNQQGFTYRGTIFHRIIPNFMIQVRERRNQTKI